MAGNIGPTLLDTLSAAIDAEALPQAWVLELSSFQLNDCSSFEPTAATILNVSQDHLDWHGDMASYAAEFLKRNPAYRAEHARMQAHIASGSVPRATAEDAFARRWGLSFRLSAR